MARITPHVPTEQRDMPLCNKSYYAGDIGPRCCRPSDHAGQCHYRCAEDGCPGLPWPASERPHPCPPPPVEQAARSEGPVQYSPRFPDRLEQIERAHQQALLATAQMLHTLLRCAAMRTRMVREDADDFRERAVDLLLELGVNEIEGGAVIIDAIASLGGSEEGRHAD